MELTFILIVLGVVALFILQSLWARKIGTRFDEETISFPRRVFRRGRFALWRRKVPLDSVDRIDPQSERTVRLYLTSAERVDVRFADREDKQAFLAAMNDRAKSRERAARHSAVRR